MRTIILGMLGASFVTSATARDQAWTVTLDKALEGGQSMVLHVLTRDQAVVAAFGAGFNSRPHVCTPCRNSR